MNIIGYRREIVLINPSLDTITITLWDDLAINERLFLQEIEMDKPVIAFCNLKRHIFEGKFQFKSTTTTMFTNPSCIEKETINIWLGNNFKERSLEELWMTHQIKMLKKLL
ncbi:replication protein A 70 kDa DNA-binding subunit B-like [Primulina eburnea]|uniref:replication protein A 70 kDa DNA-binding subunit B-like n=1 Tax=Primulina eburnea TaxID=1245227 RepID=UPI003C6C3A4E